MSNLRRSRPRPPEPAGNLHGGQLAAEVAGGVLRASPPPPQLQGDSLHRHVTAHRAAQLQQLGLSEDQLHVLAAQVGPPAPPPGDPPPSLAQLCAAGEASQRRWLRTGSQAHAGCPLALQLAVCLTPTPACKPRVSPCNPAGGWLRAEPSVSAPQHHRPAAREAWRLAATEGTRSFAPLVLVP